MLTFKWKSVADMQWGMFFSHFLVRFDCWHDRRVATRLECTRSCTAHTNPRKQQLAGHVEPLCPHPQLFCRKKCCRACWAWTVMQHVSCFAKTAKIWHNVEWQSSGWGLVNPKFKVRAHFTRNKSRRYSTKTQVQSHSIKSWFPWNYIFIFFKKTKILSPDN